MVRNMIGVDDPPLRHERYVIVFVEPYIPDDRNQTVLDEIVRIMTVDFLLMVPDSFVYPFGVSMVDFSDIALRNQFILEIPNQLDDDSTFSFVPHDEGLNKRSCPFEYSAWILFLAFPMDYQIDHYINKAMSCFTNYIFGTCRVRTKRGSLSEYLSVILLRSLTVWLLDA